MLQNALIQLLKSPQASLTYQGKTFSSRQLVARALALIPPLKALQAKSPRLALCLPNSPELFCYQLACFYIGYPIVPIIYEHDPVYIQHAIETTEAKCLLTTTQKKKLLSKGKVKLNCPIVIMDEQDQSFPSAAASKQSQSFLAPSSARPDDLAMIIFSSGTSGKLNGIMHSYQSFWGFLQTLTEVLAVDKGLTYLIAQPMGHIGGIVTLLLTLVNHGNAILLEQFEVSSYLQAMEEYQPTHINLHTPLFYELIHSPNLNRQVFSRIKTCFAGGDDIPSDLPEQFTQATGAPMQIGYGMSEIGIVTVNSNPYGEHKGSCGKMIHLANTEIALRDEDGALVAAGMTGEMWVRSPACCLGYWNMPILNKKLMLDGWFRTGDLASEDKEGYYWYKGRASQVIHRNGREIYPQPIEQVLYQYPGVRAVAVIGIHSTKEGEIPVAFVELNNPDKNKKFKEGIIQYSKKSLQRGQIPKKIFLLNKLPLNLTGKIDRRKLQKIYLDHVNIP